MRRLFTFAFALMVLEVIYIRDGSAECFDPAIEAGYATKDPLTESIVVTQLATAAKGAKWGDTIAGIAVKGQYFGCRISQAAIARKTTGQKKFSIYLPLRDSHVEGFEVDISTESRRILASRAIQVPWEVVDRTQGVTGSCTASTPTKFEGFLYGALRNAKSRRCTEAEISAFVGQPRPLPKKSH